MAENDLFFHKKLPKCDKKNLFAMNYLHSKKKFNLIVIFNRIVSKKNIHLPKEIEPFNKKFYQRAFCIMFISFLFMFSNLFFGLCMKIICKQKMAETKENLNRFFSTKIWGKKLCIWIVYFFYWKVSKYNCEFS